MSEPSLCIPRARNDTNYHQVKLTLESLFGNGCIKRVDEHIIKNVRDNTFFKRYFIHFNKWNINKTALKMQEKFLEGNTIKIVYSYPWFWKCSAMRSQKNIVLPAPRDKVTA